MDANQQNNNKKKTTRQSIPFPPPQNKTTNPTTNFSSMSQTKKRPVLNRTNIGKKLSASIASSHGLANVPSPPEKSVVKSKTPVTQRYPLENKTPLTKQRFSEGLTPLGSMADTKKRPALMGKKLSTSILTRKIENKPIFSSRSATDKTLNLSQQSSDATVDIAPEDCLGKRAVIGYEETVNYEETIDNSLTVDLTVAAELGLFDPTIEKKSNPFSWEKTLVNHVIFKDKLLPLSEDPEAMETIQINRLLGRGGNGEVYEVEYRRFHPYKYALKVPLMPLSKNGPNFEIEKTQLQKIQDVQSLHLPQILTGHFRHKGVMVPYYITYLLDPIEKALDLKEQKIVNPVSAFIAFYSLLKGLENLSSQFLIHNDIKPENIMFCQDVPMIVDFGVAKSYSEINELELWKKRGYLNGTPKYLPPEVTTIINKHGKKHILLCLDKVSQKMDIWALGLTFMEWISGHKVFDRMSLGKNIIQILMTANEHFSKGYIEQYTEQCRRKLTRMYLSTDLLTQSRLNDYDIAQLYIGIGIASDRALVEDEHVYSTVRSGKQNLGLRERFLNDIFKIFELCTSEYKNRPKASQLLEEITKLFPCALDKYCSLYKDVRKPPLTKTFIKRIPNSEDSVAKTYYMLTGQNQYDAEKREGWYSVSEEYSQGMSLNIIFDDFSPNVDTGQDCFFTAFTEQDLQPFIQELTDSNVNDSTLIKKYQLEDSKEWRFSKARKKILSGEEQLTTIFYNYRPFDIRYAIYGSVLKNNRHRVMQQMQKPNLAIIAARKYVQENFDHILCSSYITDKAIFSGATQLYTYTFPLYITSEEDYISNLSPAFIEALQENTGLSYVPASGDCKETFDSNQAFYYIYAMLHNSSYRDRYNNYLERDFPHIPITTNQNTFNLLAVLGEKLVKLHSLRLKFPATTQYFGIGSHLLESIDYRVDRIYINQKQYFEEIPEDVWEFSIGGYQVCKSWLLERQGKVLEEDQRAYFISILEIIKRTVLFIKKIDQFADKCPIE